MSFTDPMFCACVAIVRRRILKLTFGTSSFFASDIRTRLMRRGVVPPATCLYALCHRPTGAFSNEPGYDIPWRCLMTTRFCAPTEASIIRSMYYVMFSETQFQCESEMRKGRLRRYVICNLSLTSIWDFKCR